MGIVRMILIIAAIAIIYALIKRLMNPPEYKKCKKCDGKGYWLGARGRETCDVCFGSGKLPRDHVQD